MRLITINELKSIYNNPIQKKRTYLIIQKEQVSFLFNSYRKTKASN